MYAPTPDGQVHILRGAPLDRAYKHTLYWTSEASQAGYFSGLAKLSYDHMQYIRESGRVRVPTKSDDLDDCNYLMYKNQQYVDKWFYAFIKMVHYVNDNCCDIEFEIDVIQTYFFDITIRQSFIERNHTVTDAIGDNRVPEPLDIGSYYRKAAIRAWNTSGTQLWDVVAYSTFDWSSWMLTSGQIQYGTYSALTRTVLGQISMAVDASPRSYTWVTDARPKIIDLVTNHANLVDGVVAIFMTPHEFANGDVVTVNVNKPQSSWAIGGVGSYVPKNKKIWTFPFCGLYMPDTNGGGKVFAFEDFNTGSSSAQFIFYSDYAPTETVVAAPVAYKGAPSGTPNYQEAVFINGFPQCPWTSDSYKQYVAQNQSNIALTYAMSGAQVLTGILVTAATEGAGTAIGAGMITSGISGILGKVADMSDKSKIPPKVHGASSGTAFMTVGEKIPLIQTLVPREEQAIIIDNFFNVYGYAINKVDVPGIANRPHWTYVKTRDACILPKAGTGLPSAALERIIQAFDAGLTFWKNPSEVGDYSLDNRPA